MKKSRGSRSAAPAGKRSRANTTPASKATTFPASKMGVSRVSQNVPVRKKAPLANPAKPAVFGVRDNALEVAIGQEVRDIRTKMGMTASELARAAHLSLGMLSKIENGMTSASLTTLQRLAMALGVQVTALLRRFDEVRDAIYVRSGRGSIERYPTRSGAPVQPLGYPDGFAASVEPTLITLTEKSQEFPVVQHSGYEFIYMLQGEVLYRHSDKVYRMRPGDSLFFHAAAVHGPEQLVRLPIRMLSVVGNTVESARR